MLYVSGDGLRVVDQENNRGLLVDQTIEKVGVFIQLSFLIYSIKKIRRFPFVPPIATMIGALPTSVETEPQGDGCVMDFKLPRNR